MLGTMTEEAVQNLKLHVYFLVKEAQLTTITDIINSLWKHMSRFGKTRIAHTSNVAHLQIHKNHRECRFDIFQDDKGIIDLLSLSVSYLSVIPKRVYNSSNLKNWLYELCTFSQIQPYRYIESKHDFQCIIIIVAIKSYHLVQLSISR